jgi:mono/diheme cytochrome c family protein
MVCHGINGRGNEMRAGMPTIPDFMNAPWQEGLSDPQLTVSILLGKGTLMPAFRDRLTDDQAHALAGYVRGFLPTLIKAAAAPPSDVDKQLRELQEQMEALQKQSKDPSKQSRKP